MNTFKEYQNPLCHIKIMEMEQEALPNLCLLFCQREDVCQDSREATLLFLYLQTAMGYVNQTGQWNLWPSSFSCQKYRSI